MAFNQRRKDNIRLSRNIVLQKNETKHLIKQSQRHMSDLTEKLSIYKPFDNTVSPEDCVDRLVSHRIVSKFHIRDSAVAKDLQSAAFRKFLSYDDSLQNETYMDPLLLKAKAFLYRMFLEFKVDFSDVRYEVTPGETYTSSSGEVSILAKLFDIKHWTVTANCIDDACVFIYNTSAFKRAAKQHIGRVTRKERRSLYFRFRNKADIGYHVFKYLLVDRVFTIVDGARASTVPKSNEQRRFINIEAMFSVIVQRAIAFEFLDHLRHAGNDLGNIPVSYQKDVTGIFKVDLSAQKLHGELISKPHYATIDFSNASDSVTMQAVASLFPKQVVDTLFKARSHYVLIEGELYPPKKLSSMGNGFTFEVMTSLLYAIGRSFTSDVRVYGDDVIIPNVFAADFVRVCNLIDFRVNEKKTFINSFFRESCGYFYSDHLSDYITSFDFSEIISLSDVIITCNKLTTILEARQVSDELSVLLEVTRDRLSASIHASRKGPVPPSDALKRKYLALYVFDSKYRIKQKRSKELNLLRKHYVARNGSYFEYCQISRFDISLIYVPFFVPTKSSHLFSSEIESRQLLPALYSGKRLNAVIKGKGKWVDLPAFVSSDGTITLLSNLISSQSIWHDRLSGVVSTHERR